MKTEPWNDAKHRRTPGVQVYHGGYVWTQQGVYTLGKDGEVFALRLGRVGKKGQLIGKSLDVEKALVVTAEAEGTQRDQEDARA